MDRVRRNAVKLKSSFPHNRLIGHLKTCALAYGCPNAQNFFLSRYEAPLPVSPSCNARCSGCISYQVRTRCPAAQPRIAFVPRPHEIAEVALFHIENVRDPVVSFGQGCEGEPLLEALTVERAIRLVRRKTSKGTIHMNTNASRPKDMGRLFDAGLSSIRVSLNSVRDEHYMRYYKPRAYAFRDVVSSIKIAKKRGAFVSVNYLTMPGFTDSRDEFNALKIFIEAHRIDMIQWRNLNFDPLRYFRMLKVRIDRPDMIGIREVIGLLTREFPDLMMGYFNPSRLGMGRHRR
jgi:MoaA/NifB/PqqE/SkfB family radical SAM enzyme